jgi:hypothetical protein
MFGQKWLMTGLTLSVAWLTVGFADMSLYRGLSLGRGGHSAACLGLRHD